MRSNWIDLKYSSQYVLTSLPPLTKQTLTEGLVQASHTKIAHKKCECSVSQFMCLSLTN